LPPVCGGRSCTGAVSFPYPSVNNRSGEIAQGEHDPAFKPDHKGGGDPVGRTLFYHYVLVHGFSARPRHVFSWQAKEVFANRRAFLIFLDAAPHR